ncbi:MAG: G8 domain-containing protein, partial [Candidatus Paceibacterota bacterium]
MADFLSVTSGVQNDGATWGKTSPGEKGTDWPGNAGDTFTVAVGHTVTYNVSETNELGAVTVNGTLTASRSMSTKITLDNTSLSIGATGVFDFGTEVSPIPVPYTCDVIFNTTGDNEQGFANANGGAYSICGDPDYCSVWESTLANNAENTDNDDTIITNDDMEGDWQIGYEITIQREQMGDSSSHTDAVVHRTITGISGTTITLDATLTGVTTGVGDTWESKVVCVSRNVRIYKKDAVTDIQSASRYNTNRPKFTDGTTGTNSNYIKNAQVTGFYTITIQGGAFINCVIRHGERTFSGSNNNTITGSNLYACNYGFYGSNNNTITGSNLYACNYGFGSSSSNNTITGSNLYACNTGFGSSSSNNTITGNNLYACNTGFGSSSSNNTVSGSIYACNYGFYSSNNNMVSGKLGYTQEDASSPNTYDIRASSITCLNVKMPAAGLVFYDRNTISGVSEVMSEHHNRELNSHLIYRNMGDVVKTSCDGEGTSPFVDPDGGSADCIEVSNLQSNLSNFDCIKVFLPYRNQIYAQSSVEKTYTLKI